MLTLTAATVAHSSTSWTRRPSAGAAARAPAPRTATAAITAMSQPQPPPDGQWVWQILPVGIYFLLSSGWTSPAPRRSTLPV